MEEILFASERRIDREDVAALLRTVADNLEAGDSVTLSVNEESVTLDVPQRPEFEVTVEREMEGSTSELSVEFELEWDEGDSGSDGELRVE